MIKRFTSKILDSNVYKYKQLFLRHTILPPYLLQQSHRLDPTRISSTQHYKSAAKLKYQLFPQPQAEQTAILAMFGFGHPHYTPTLTRFTPEQQHRIQVGQVFRQRRRELQQSGMSWREAHQQTREEFYRQGRQQGFPQEQQGYPQGPPSGFPQRQPSGFPQRPPRFPPGPQDDGGGGDPYGHGGGGGYDDSYEGY
jgi:hypothetical protein